MNIGSKRVVKGLLSVCVAGLLSSPLSVVTAANVVIESLNMQQGSLISAKIPQFDSGLAPTPMARLNEQFRQVVLKRLPDFETVSYQTRLAPQLPTAIKASFTFMADFEVFRNDPDFLSLTQQVYQYTGGAHGMTWQVGHTIDLATGRQLMLADLFLPEANYAERLSQFVRAEGAARQLPMWEFKGVNRQSAFYLSNDGIVLFFQQYEIAPYSAGIIKMQIPYRQVADILRTELRLW
jgi:hypothetical protein